MGEEALVGWNLTSTVIEQSMLKDLKYYTLYYITFYFGRKKGRAGGWLDCLNLTENSVFPYELT